MKMNKNIQWKQSSIDYDKLNQLSHQQLIRIENGKQTISQNVSFEGRKKAGLKNVKTGHIKKLGLKYGPIVGKKWGKINGDINAKSGHMKEIQKIGCIIGGIISGNKKTKEEMKEISKLGNEANQQKYGKRIIATNLITGECWEFISYHEAARDTNIPTCTIRKILKGKQPKTKTGWTFTEK